MEGVAVLDIGEFEPSEWPFADFVTFDDARQPRGVECQLAIALGRAHWSRTDSSFLLLVMHQSS